MQYAYAISPSVGCHALQYFSTLSHKWNDFRGGGGGRGGKLLITKCVFLFSVRLLSETFLILRKTGLNILRFGRPCIVV